MEEMRIQSEQRKLQMLHFLNSAPEMSADEMTEKMKDPVKFQQDIIADLKKRALNCNIRVPLRQVDPEKAVAELKERLKNGPPSKGSKKQGARVRRESVEPSRKSGRLVNAPARFSYTDLFDDDFDENDGSGKRRRKRKTMDDDDEGEWRGEKQRSSQVSRGELKPYVKRDNTYGPIDDVKVGMWWATRMECNRDGIHRPPVSGIHGGPDGAYSVALSGGYAENEDEGDHFWYTGEGGRELRGTKANPKNLRTAPQTKDQGWTRGNAALYRSIETKNPVRVIRGFSKNKDYKSPWAPEDGYRYDGLYEVINWKVDNGVSGFNVFKFEFQRLPNQDPIQMN